MAGRVSQAVVEAVTSGGTARVSEAVVEALVANDVVRVSQVVVEALVEQVEVAEPTSGRPLSIDMAAALAAESGELLYLFEFAFQSTTARFATTSHDVAWGGVTFTAIGGALVFDLISESGDLSASGVQVRLAGVDQSAVAPALTERYVGRNVRVWLASFDATKKTIVATPVLVFSGLMNGAIEIEERAGSDGRSGGTVDIRMSVTDRLGALDQRRGIRTNKESHQHLFPGDEFFSSIGEMVNLQLPWGREG